MSRGLRAGVTWSKGVGGVGVSGGQVSCDLRGWRHTERLTMGH